MLKRFPGIVLLMLSLTSANASSAEDGAVGIADNCLMMVVTKNTDPAKEAEFNHWYDKIDIPDVLEVPGYMRARRGLGQSVPEFPTADLQPQEGPYIALYDIDSNDLNRTIIDMLMLAKRMDQTDRSTPLLSVLERVYFHQYRSVQESSPASVVGKNRYLYVVKVDCCADPSKLQQFDDWYDNRYLPTVLGAPGYIRGTRYRLHRVVMVDPVPMPQFLTVFEIVADSPQQAMAHGQRVIDAMRNSGRMSPLYAESGATVYLQIADVARPATGD